VIHLQEKAILHTEEIHEGRELRSLLGKHVAPMVSDRRRNIETAPAKELTTPRKICVFSIRKERFIEERHPFSQSLHELRVNCAHILIKTITAKRYVFDVFPFHEKARTTSSEDVALFLILSGRRLPRPTVEVTKRQLKPHPRGIKNRRIEGTKFMISSQKPWASTSDTGITLDASDQARKRRLFENKIAIEHKKVRVSGFKKCPGAVVMRGAEPHVLSIGKELDLRKR